jgi:cytochrome c oxidase subunit IV
MDYFIPAGLRDSLIGKKEMTMHSEKQAASVQQATKIWLLLMLATASAAGLSFLPINGLLLTAITILILIWKGQMIVDYFMGLKTASVFWRVVMSAYCVVIGLAVMGVYYLGI